MGLPYIWEVSMCLWKGLEREHSRRRNKLINQFEVVFESLG